MSDDFLSQDEVTALLKGVTSTEDDWAEAMAEVNDPKLLPSHINEIEQAIVLLVQHGFIVKARRKWMTSRKK